MAQAYTEPGIGSMGLVHRGEAWMTAEEQSDKLGRKRVLKNPCVSVCKEWLHRLSRKHVGEKKRKENTWI